MFFLDFWKPSTWLSEASEGIMGAITSGIRTLCFSLDTLIYKLIINLYEMFDALCKARLLDNSVIEAMAKRIGLILGLIMFFYVVFSFVKMLIDPDKITDKEAGATSIVKKSIIVIILLAVSNYGFNMLYRIQALVINNDVVSKLILPMRLDDNTNENFGNYLSEELMYAFYQVDNFENVKAATVAESNMISDCKSMTESFRAQIVNNGRFDLGYNCLNESVNVTYSDSNGQQIEDQVYIINFNWIISIIAGVVVAYLLLMYCFSVGVRMVQLAFLEILSPMAIVGYLAPKKDNMLSKWWKVYFSTYIDVFIRIAIINFVVFLITTIFATSDEGGKFMFWQSIGNPTDTATRSFFLVVIVIALLTFAKKAPDLLKEIMPSVGASKLGFGAKVKDMVGLGAGLGMVAGAGVGAAVGLIGGAAGGKGVLGKVTGALGGATGGVFRGGAAGRSAKGLGKAVSTAATNQAKATLNRQQMALSGATFSDRFGTALNQKFGIMDSYERLSAENSSYGDLKNTVEDEQNVKNAQFAYNAALEKYINDNPGASATDFENSTRGKALKTAIDNAKDVAYKDLMKKDKAFQTKVDMHNRRFGTRYSDASSWDSINTKRKAVKAEFEATQARKPKK